MTRSCFLIVLLLAVAMGGSKLSLAAGESGGGGIPTTLGRELRELISKASDFSARAAPGRSGRWHAAAATGDGADAIRASLRSTARGRPARKSAANCIPADMCRKKKVLCGKRCYRSSSSSSLSHIPSTKCVVKCKKCVPTC